MSAEFPSSSLIAPPRSPCPCPCFDHGTGIGVPQFAVNVSGNLCKALSTRHFVAASCELPGHRKCRQSGHRARRCKATRRPPRGGDQLKESEPGATAETVRGKRRIPSGDHGPNPAYAAPETHAEFLRDFDRRLMLASIAPKVLHGPVGTVSSAATNHLTAATRSSCGGSTGESSVFSRGAPAKNPKAGITISSSRR